MPRLVLLSGPGVGVEHALASPCVVGRAAGCGVHVEEESVSREHARLFERDGVWNVVDLHSRNGTFVNGTRVTTAPLRAGDELMLGRVRLRFAADPPPGAVVEEIELEQPAEPVRAAPSVRAETVPSIPTIPSTPRRPGFSPPPPSAPPAPPRAPAAALPSGVRRTASGAILLDHAGAPGGALGEDLGQRGLLYRLGIFAALLGLAAGAFFAAKLATRFLSPPTTEQEVQEGAAEPGGNAPTDR